MSTRITNKELMEAINGLTESINSLNKRVTTLESGKLSTAKTSSKKSTTSTKKKSAPKSETPKQTREERLEEQFGSKELRTKYVGFRNKVAEEFKALAESEGLYIPKAKYRKVLKDCTDSMCKYSEVKGQKCLTVKLDKNVVRKMFLASAK